MAWDVLPLRAIVFQFLFLLLAIAIEGLIFHRILNLGHKISMQYAASVNLLSTFIGWVIFYSAQPYLPADTKLQLISYIFYERFLFNTVPVDFLTTLILTLVGVYVATSVLELWGLNRLEIFLGRVETPEVKEVEKPARFRGRQNQAIGPKVNSRFFAVFLGNACSFFLILLILMIRLFNQARYSTL
ncbi:hypothetical protein K9N68_18910 [Kovacikia minuta CCNUW1]|uniref:filament integrity protein FraC n=1 Tax=Kovacikia minuta TaxID=2931930 RepID=UPI001CCC5D0B|nr:filament integrity protein FraC [Kovacikia minuta]UBF23823.1 hypothetical protein K9N68_18910 [Kovacikia minuta CCNUW1]